VADSVLSVATTKGVALDIDELPSATVEGDSRRLEQVFYNLLGNALKFTPAGGTVRLGARVETGAAVVSVTDNGMGIDPQFLPHVFDRFRQGGPSISHHFGGLGLGLSIAKQLTEAHRGTIEVSSAGVGCGAAFTVRLPVAPGPRPAAGEPGQDGAEWASQGS
jgi:signal transduction histidine kinase